MNATKLVDYVPSEYEPYDYGYRIDDETIWYYHHAHRELRITEDYGDCKDAKIYINQETEAEFIGFLQFLMARVPVTMKAFDLAKLEPDRLAQGSYWYWLDRINTLYFDATRDELCIRSKHRDCDKNELYLDSNEFQEIIDFIAYAKAQKASSE